jgi:hypothetical protein
MLCGAYQPPTRAKPASFRLKVNNKQTRFHLSTEKAGCDPNYFRFLQLIRLAPLMDVFGRERRHQREKHAKHSAALPHRRQTSPR